MKFLRQGLETTGNFGNFVDAILVAAPRALQQLKIIDDDEADIVAAFQPARAGAQGRDGQARRIVDEQRQFLQFPRGAGQVLEIGAADLAHAQRFAADPRLLRQHAGRQLIGGHFEREEGSLGPHILFGRDAVRIVAQPAGRGIIGNVGGERGLAHARATGQDHQVRIVQTTDFRVQAVDAGRDARHMAATVERAFGNLHGGGRGGQKALDRSALTFPFGYFIERDFGRLYLFAGIDILARIHCIFNQFPANADKLSQQGQVVDLRREIARADQRSAIAGQLRQIARPAQFPERRVLIQHGFERHWIGDHVAVQQLHDRVIDAAMHRLEKMLGLDLELNILRQPVVDHQRAEQGCFRLHIAGEFRRAGFGGIVHFYEFDHAPLFLPPPPACKAQG